MIFSAVVAIFASLSACFAQNDGKTAVEKVAFCNAALNGTGDEMDQGEFEELSEADLLPFEPTVSFDGRITTPHPKVVLFVNADTKPNNLRDPYDPYIKSEVPLNAVVNIPRLSESGEPVAHSIISGHVIGFSGEGKDRKATIEITEWRDDHRGLRYLVDVSTQVVDKASRAAGSPYFVGFGNARFISKPYQIKIID